MRSRKIGGARGIGEALGRDNEWRGPEPKIRSSNTVAKEDKTSPKSPKPQDCQKNFLPGFYSLPTVMADPQVFCPWPMLQETSPVEGATKPNNATWHNTAYTEQ